MLPVFYTFDIIFYNGNLFYWSVLLFITVTDCTKKIIHIIQRPIILIKLIVLIYHRYYNNFNFYYLILSPWVRYLGS